MVMTSREIQNILPHRYPFLLVDKIIHLELDKKVIGLKSVSINEPFFQGHFPGQPIMPGVLIIEAMAQTWGILVLSSEKEKAGSKNVLFLGIDKARERTLVDMADRRELASA